MESPSGPTLVELKERSAISDERDQMQVTSQEDSTNPTPTGRPDTIQPPPGPRPEGEHTSALHRASVTSRPQCENECGGHWSHPCSHSGMGVPCPPQGCAG